MKMNGNKQELENATAEKRKRVSLKNYLIRFLYPVIILLLLVMVLLIKTTSFFLEKNVVTHSTHFVDTFVGDYGAIAFKGDTLLLKNPAAVLMNTHRVTGIDVYNAQEAVIFQKKKHAASKKNFLFFSSPVEIERRVELNGAFYGKIRFKVDASAHLELI
ncbi:MAG: hypothetical protein GY757_15065, partial [bacterium]|nr:hypothetical protein [bacterium]